VHRLSIGAFFCVAAFIGVTSLPAAAQGDVVQLRDDHPNRYTVVKGDTLWDIATRFLKSPWHWPKIWKLNQQIENPHLIYPGDVIVLQFVDGQPELTLLRNGKLPVPVPAQEAGMAPAPSERTIVGPAPSGIPTVKLSPRVHAESLREAIPTIPPDRIAPFLSQPLAVTEGELEAAGYITVGLDDRIALGDQSEFYARGLNGVDQEFYQVFRKGNPMYDPDSGELLAFEAVYLGDAIRLESGDPSKFVVTRVKQEIVPSDRLLAASRNPPLPYYYPRPPETQIRGQIISALNAVAEVGPFTIVAINRGTREGIEEGHVLRVMRHVGEHRDPVSRDLYQLPDEQSGLILVFRTYEKVSYALVMDATRPIHIHDSVVTP
jgi:hypothetical protein